MNKIIQTIKDDNGLARMVKSQLGQVKKEKKDNKLVVLEENL